jgi:hypothetical protein
LKKLIIVLLSVFILRLTVFAQNDMNISEPTIKRIENLGIDLKKVEFAELEPNEITTYDSFSKKEFSKQAKDIFYWSTIWHNNLSRLNITTKASSTLKGYGISNLLDKKIDTAWVEGAKDAGIGEMISIIINTQVGKYNADRTSGLFNFGVIPGYSKSNKTWLENNRIKRALFIIERKVAEGKNSYTAYVILRLKFKDKNQLQVFDIEKYDNYSDVRYNAKFWLIIEDVYKGTKYNDTCISEIAIDGGIAVCENEP